MFLTWHSWSLSCCWVFQQKCRVPCWLWWPGPRTGTAPLWRPSRCGSSFLGTISAWSVLLERWGEVRLTTVTSQRSGWQWLAEWSISSCWESPGTSEHPPCPSLSPHWPTPPEYKVSPQQIIQTQQPLTWENRDTLAINWAFLEPVSLELVSLVFGDESRGGVPASLAPVFLNSEQSPVKLPS